MAAKTQKPRKSSGYGVRLVRGPFINLPPHRDHTEDVEAFLRYTERLRRQGERLAADFFSGAGGLSLGLEKAGYKVVFGADHEPFANRTHAHHFGGMSVDWDLADPGVVREVAELCKAAHVDLIAGGPPCQPFSKAGRSMIRHQVESGLRDRHDQRRDLWLSYLEIIRVAKPRAVIMENVPVDRVAGDPKKYRTLTEVEMNQILDHDCRDRHVFMLALYGLRRGELAGLKWSHINLTDKPIGEGEDELPALHLRVVENRVTIGKKIETGTPKSAASKRTLPLPTDAVEALKTARKRQAEEQLKFGPGYGTGDYVARNEAGQPYHPNLIWFRWSQMLKELKIKHVRLHDGRHTCGSVMHARGVPLADISAWLGHASSAFTLSVYVHSQANALQAAAASFDRVVTTRDTETGSGG